MKKVISLVLALVVVLGGVGLIACGGGEGGTTPPPSNGGAPPGGDLTWDDMPVYPGAKQVEKGEGWGVPPPYRDWPKMEWRYYYVSEGGLNDAEAFYQSQMPDEGWQEVMWTSVHRASWGFFQKNNEQHGAMVWIRTDVEKGGIDIAFMRGVE